MKSVKKLTTFIRPYTMFAILAPLLMALEVVMDLIQPTIMQHIIDTGIAMNDRAYVIRMTLFMLLAAFAGLIGGVGCTIYSTKAAVNTAADIRKNVFRKVEYFSSENRDHFTTGKLLTIATNDISSIQNALMMTLRVLVRGPLLFIGSIIIVLLTAKELFPILLISIPILLICIVIITKKAGRLFGMVQSAIDRVNTKLGENLAGMRVIKAYGRKDHEIKKFSKVNHELTEINTKATHIISLMMPIMLFAVNMGIIATLWFGGFKVNSGSIEVGVIIAFINYLNIMLNALMSSSMVLIQISRALPSADRIVEILETKVDTKEPIKPFMPKTITGDLEFRNVSFSYSKNGEYVLKNVSFKAKHGEKIGIIGSTGSGKTSLVKLIPRLYDVGQGEILLDDVNIKYYDLHTLRSVIAVSPQKALLFSGTIGENIRYGKETALAEEVENAAMDACATEFIHQLADGYEHRLSQGATNLSGGQKQRVSIARALVRKPKILILDDSTSAVDSLSEASIQKALQRNYQDTTKIIIASKISSIYRADQIIVIDDGKICDIGTHEELLKTSPVYMEIYMSQGGKGLQDYE